MDHPVAVFTFHLILTYFMYLLLFYHMIQKAPEKWQNSAENGRENPENGVKKWLDTLMKRVFRKSKKK